MSSLKSKWTNVVDRETNPEADRYRLLVTAGPSYDPSTHRVVSVNHSTPTPLENDAVRAKVKVRIRNYQGLPADSPLSSPYFDHPAHTKDQYSIAFSLVPKRDLSGLDAAFGNDFDHPIRDRLPPGFNTAFRILKDFIDPGLECDAHADQPWMLGPALSSWFVLRIGDKLAPHADIPELPEHADILHEGADGSGVDVRQRLGLAADTTSDQRRKFFLSDAHRQRFTFEKDRLYHVDFSNPYLDFGNFSVKLPGFSLKVIKYIDDKSHVLRYVFKDRAAGHVYLCVNLNLLWGDSLQRVLAGDALRQYAGAHAPEPLHPEAPAHPGTRWGSRG